MEAALRSTAATPARLPVIPTTHPQQARFSLTDVVTGVGEFFQYLSGANHPAKLIGKLLEMPIVYKRSENNPIFTSPFKAADLEKINRIYNSFPERPWTKDRKYQDQKIAAIQLILDEIHELTKDRPELRVIREMMVAEIVSKEFAGVDADPGHKIKLPVVDSQGNSRMVEFTVAHKVYLHDTKIPVVALTPEDHEFAPIVLFRSTSPYPCNEGGFRSIFENIDPKGPARTRYDNTLPQFRTMMDELSAYAPPRVIGYSQGGCLAQRFIVDFNDKLSQKELSIVYNAPAAEKDYKDRWNRIPESQRTKVVNFVFEHDIVSKCGDQFIGMPMLIETEQRGSFLSPHFDVKLFSENWKVYGIDEQAEEQSEDRAILKMLQTSGKVNALYHAIISNFGPIDDASEHLTRAA